MLILAQHFTFVTVFRVFVVHYTFLYYHWICSYCRDILWYCKCFSIILSTAYISLSPSLPSPSRPYVFVIAVVMITLWLTLIRVQAHTSERMSPFLSLYQFLSLSSSSLVLLSCVERLSALFFLSLSLCLPGDGGEIGEIAVRLRLTPPQLVIAWIWTWDEICGWIMSGSTTIYGCKCSWWS